MTYRTNACTPTSVCTRRILAPAVVLTALSLAMAAMTAPAAASVALSAGTVIDAGATTQVAAVTPEVLRTPPPALRHGKAAPTPARPDDIARAVELEARAWAMRDLMDHYPAAARLYREAADLRPDHDPQKVQNLRQASRMSYYSHRSGQASHDAEAAARLALRQGDVLTAADSYVDAAWLAGHAGEAERFEALVQAATLLAGSPLLAELQREQLLSRLEAAA